LVGIIGYIGRKKAMPVLLQGLKSLECCDYDSVGIATLSRSLRICKGVGRFDRAVRDSDLKDLKGNIGIAHTRRATQGRICKANAHPHIDCKKSVAVVHNGMISNYRELKEMLLKEGHVFSSSTDSEVIAHLIEEKQNRGVSIETACNALLVISEKPRRVIAFRNGLPLAIGLTDGGFIFASSEPALNDCSHHVIHIQNNSMAVACRKEVVMHNI
jgi:glucosamine--fructose-6-phosphate aminotransferase (isomerizing)